MTVEELIEELEVHDPQAEVILIWHGYMRDITAVSATEDDKVELENSPRTKP